MNKKFINALLFSAALLSSGAIVTSCDDYDDDINSLNDRVTAIETTIADIQAKIGEGYFIKSCNYSSGVLTLELSNGQTYTIKDGAKGDTGATGTPGTPGSAGKNGTIWQINETTKNWEYKNDGDTDWTDTGINAQGLPGTQGAQGVHAESPYIGEDGNWVIWEWDAEQNKFVEKATNITASGTTSYVVDKGLYYELHMALGTIDTEGNFTATDKDFSEIRLPKTHALTDLKAYSVTNEVLGAPVVNVTYHTIGNKDVTFNNNTYTKNTVQVSENSKLTVKVNPTEADVKLYNFSLIDSKGKSIFSINSENIVANTSENPLKTRTATVNNGFYDMPLVVNAGLKSADITSTANVAYALATTNYNDDQITTDYEIEIKAVESNNVAEKTTWSGIALTKTTEKDTWTFAEIWEMVKAANTNTPDVIDYYFVLPENQTAAAEGCLTVDQDAKTITVLKNSTTPIKLYVNYVTLNGTAVESNAEGKAVNDNKQAKEIAVTLKSSSEATIGDVNWTIQADNASTTNDETKLTVEVTGLDQFWTADKTLTASDVVLEFVNDKIIVNGEEDKNATVEGITLVQRIKTDNKGYKRYYLEVDFNETKVYAEPVIATLKLSNGNEDKEVSFNINVTNPAEAYFEFQRVDAYFNESGEASVYDKGDSWDNASNIIFNLSKLFKNVNATDNKFTFEEVVPELKAGNATAWLQSGDKISIGQYKLQENKDGVNINTGIGSTRTFKIGYRPFGNVHLNSVVEEFQFTGRSVVNEGKFYWGTATAAGKAIELTNSATEVRIDADGFYGIEHGSSEAYKFYDNSSSKIKSYKLVGDENAKTFFDIENALTTVSTEGTGDKAKHFFSINRKSNANVEKQVNCVFTLTLTDRCGMPKVATVTVTLLPNE